MAIFALVKYHLVLLFTIILTALATGQDLFAQDRGEGMHLLSSTGYLITDKTRIRHYNPVYEHKDNRLSADSGDWRRDELGREYFDAYGHIVITQPSGTVIYADRLNYEAETQHAVLTHNVRVVDKTSVLTTNYMTYNFRDQRGTYTGGGRIINGPDTITSRNAYYFERTKDSYFREKVVVRTPDVQIFTDTMRYNSLQRETYFFGPTNIKGHAGENLYTERGTYNTGTGIAKFNLNNLYTEGSKFLKGDSLYYERSVGDGEAFRNVVFVDTLEKFYADGGYGKYRSKEESITMADKPLVKIVVSNDTTEEITAEPEPETEESLSRRERRQRERELQRQAEFEENGGLQDTIILPLDSIPIRDSLQAPPVDSPVDTVYLTADTIFSKMILVKEYNPLILNLDRDGGQLIDDDDVDYGDDEEMGDDPFGGEIETALINEAEALEGLKGLTDSLALAGDTIPPKVLPTDPPDTIEQVKPPITLEQIVPARPPLPGAPTISQTMLADSVLRQNAQMPTGNEANQLISEAMTAVMKTDSIIQDTSAIHADTARTRIVKAYHNVRLYKSDLQAVADSAYYGMLDSMFRFMGDPMIWAEESQISSDTIFMQMVNQKLDNALLKNNAFMVNALTDSIRFNQLKGRKITVFFKNNNIERLFVDGNAENLVFNSDERTGIITDMFHDRGARIKVLFEGKQVMEYTTAKANQYVYPLKMVTQENEILDGFVWKPLDRPTSMQDMMDRKRLPREQRNQVAATEGENSEDESSTSGRPTTPIANQVSEEAVEEVEEEETTPPPQQKVIEEEKQMNEETHNNVPPLTR